MWEKLGEAARASSLRALRARNSVGKSWGRAGKELGESWARAGEELGKELGKSWGRAGRELGKSWENCEHARYIYQKPKIRQVFRQVFDPGRFSTSLPSLRLPPLRRASGPERNVQRWGALPVPPPLRRASGLERNVQRWGALPVI